MRPISHTPAHWPPREHCGTLYAGGADHAVDVVALVVERHGHVECQRDIRAVRLVVHLDTVHGGSGIDGSPWALCGLSASYRRMPRGVTKSVMRAPPGVSPAQSPVNSRTATAAVGNFALARSSD